MRFAIVTQLPVQRRVKAVITATVSKRAIISCVKVRNFAMAIVRNLTKFFFILGVDFYRLFCYTIEALERKVV